MTLTKATLVDRFKPKVQEFEHELLGKFYIKQRTELLRCRRIGALWDKSGNAIPEQHARRRAYSLIDQLCDSEGNNLFKESDLDEVLSLASESLDPIMEAIAVVNNELEKNDTGE